MSISLSSDRFASFLRRSALGLAPLLLAGTLLAQPPGDAQHFGFDALVQQPATQSSFTFDRTMLQAADGFFNGADPETRRVVAGLNSITVHNYNFHERASYDPGAFASVAEGFHGAGWKHLVNANGHPGQTTDLWIHFEGANIRNVIVLNRGGRNMNYIAVDCTLRPLDLLHLSGHFGIPKVDESAVMVPAK